ncbi:MAG: hypothetical protein HYZ54_05655 [Ignavibacteriae bacterium]|nr:hypothetical protein [Ignavibacteriota bacterium]
MVQIIFNAEKYQEMIETIALFKEIDGDDEKSLELEDFYALVELGRSIIWHIEETEKGKKND